MNTDFIVPGGKKGILHTKSASGRPIASGSNFHTYEVMSAFGISEKALKSLSSENFIGRVGIIKYPSADAANVNVLTTVRASYNSENHTVTYTWRSNYGELQFISIEERAFWVE